MPYTRSAAGALIPAYILHSERQGRLAEVWRVVAWVGAIYLGGIIVSLWTGPIYPYQVASGGKIYGSFVIPRGSGFSQSVNAAGGIRRGARHVLLVSVSTLGAPLVAAERARPRGPGWDLVQERSGRLWRGGLRVGQSSGSAPHIDTGRRARAPAPALLLRSLPSAAIIAGVVSFQQPIVAAAWQRLLLDREQQTTDVDTRLQIWQGHASAWASKDFADQLTGSRASGAAV